MNQPFAPGRVLFDFSADNSDGALLARDLE